METSIATLISPSTISTARYEYRGEIKLPENDTLAWIAEEIGGGDGTRSDSDFTD